MDIRDFTYETTNEDEKLRFFVEQCQPAEVDVSSIKRMTYRKIARQKARRRHQWMAVAAAACVVLAFGLGFLLRGHYEPAIQKQVAVAPKVEQQMLTLHVPQGETRTVTLADGTVITAGSRTRITYPKEFTGTDRPVEIDGEAFFEVAHDKQHPFIVHANGFDVTVLGTKFNVNSYKGATAEVALLEGAVQISNESGTLRLRPNQVATISNGHIQSLQECQAEDYTSWQKGYINLNGETMPRILQRLNRYYGTNLICSRDADTTRQFYGKLILQKDIHSVVGSLNGQR